jgi:hypothetical protein
VVVVVVGGRRPQGLGQVLAYAVERVGDIVAVAAAQQVGGTRTHCPVGVHTQSSSISLTKKKKNRPSNEMTSVANPGCLSPDPDFSIPDPGSRVKKIPDPGFRIQIRI